MIWSSPERLPVRGGVHVAASAQRCVWDEIGGALVATESSASPQTPREQELEAAYRRGRAEGEQAAHARARREVETALSAARSVVREVRDAHAGWSRVLEDNLAALATAVATHLVQRELAADPGVQRDLVRQAIAAFPTTQEIRVRVHPSDLAVLTRGAEAGGEARPAEIRWVADDGVLPGGCLVEGPERIVDGRLDEGLKRIYQVLAHG